MAFDIPIDIEYSISMDIPKYRRSFLIFGAFLSQTLLRAFWPSCVSHACSPHNYQYTYYFHRYRQFKTGWPYWLCLYHWNCIIYILLKLFPSNYSPPVYQLFSLYICSILPTPWIIMVILARQILGALLGTHLSFSSLLLVLTYFISLTNHFT